MIRWKDSEPNRLHQQEQALLALCDRLTVLERVVTEEAEAHRLTRKRLDYVQKELAQTVVALARLTRENRVLVELLERGK